MNTSFIKKGRNIATFPDPYEEHEILGPNSKLHKNVGKQKPEECKVAIGVNERSQLRAPYDYNIFKTILTQSDRFQNLKPTVALQILGEQHKHKNFKKIAILRLEADFKKQFTIFSHTIKNKESAVKPIDDVSQNIFRWSWNDFLTRRGLKNVVWVDILLRMEEHFLHIYKFQTDFEELRMFLEKLFDGLISHTGQQNVDIYQHIEKPIEEAKRVLHVTDSVEDELYINSKELKHLTYKEHFFLNAQRISEDRLLKVHLENRIWKSHISDPIEVRYRSNWLQNIVKQNQYHRDKALDKYESDMAHHKQMLILETFINDNCMNYCYSSIEMYKNCIVELQDKFDKELDEMENKLAYIRLQTHKLREQRKWLSVEVERFHEEEEKMRLRNEMEKDNEEQQSQKKSKNLDSKKVPRKRNMKKRG